jgi:CubicO group peptidase (beta-lactamase class C family)
MTTHERAVTLRSQGYGYLWWKRTFEHGGVQLESIYAAGNGGNYVFIVPSHELVVAFTGSNYNTSRSDTPHRIMPLVVSALP